jgi:hypothetical protein
MQDAEVWSMVTFVKKVRTVSDADFRAWTAVAGDAAKP